MKTISTRLSQYYENIQKWKATPDVVCSHQPSSSSTSALSDITDATSGSRSCRQNQAEDGDIEIPVQTVRLSSRCVLLTYFEGDAAACIDQHFRRALQQLQTTTTTATSVETATAVASDCPQRIFTNADNSANAGLTVY